MRDFKSLINNISDIHNHLQKQAASAINKTLTIRNWLIGYYIVEYEQNGNDRAKYGDRLIENVADKLKHVRGIDRRSLFKFRQFYLFYPQLANTIRGEITPLLPDSKKVGTATPILPDLSKVGAINPLLKQELFVSGDKILSKLSYSHIEQLLRLREPLKRTFYEIECIKSTWTVRELKRQIASLYYERSGLSAKPELLSAKVQQNIKPQKTTDIIKNIYTFEFLDLKIKDVVEESDLETALLDHLQEFILELGNGFCFEQRQKRILIGENYYFIDLVFYHRVLKCHVIIELKIGDFNHGDVGQLNTYLNYFKQEISEANDNPPAGILLVANKDQALVKYATAGMDENLFVQQYLVRLPSKEQLEIYINNELRRLE